MTRAISATGPVMVAARSAAHSRANSAMAEKNSSTVVSRCAFDSVLSRAANVTAAM